MTASTQSIGNNFNLLNISAVNPGDPKLKLSAIAAVDYPPNTPLKLQFSRYKPIRDQAALDNIKTLRDNTLFHLISYPKVTLEDLSILAKNPDEEYHHEILSYFWSLKNIQAKVASSLVNESSFNNFENELDADTAQKINDQLRLAYAEVNDLLDYTYNPETPNSNIQKTQNRNDAIINSVLKYFSEHTFSIFLDRVRAGTVDPEHFQIALKSLRETAFRLLESTRHHHFVLCDALVNVFCFQHELESLHNLDNITAVESNSRLYWTSIRNLLEGPLNLQGFKTVQDIDWLKVLQNPQLQAGVTYAALWLNSESTAPLEQLNRTIEDFFFERLHDYSRRDIREQLTAMPAESTTLNINFEGDKKQVLKTCFQHMAEHTRLRLSEDQNTTADWKQRLEPGISNAHHIANIIVDAFHLCKNQNYTAKEFWQGYMDFRNSVAPELLLQNTEHASTPN